MILKWIPTYYGSPRNKWTNEMVRSDLWFRKVKVQETPSLGQILNDIHQVTYATVSKNPLDFARVGFSVNGTWWPLTMNQHDRRNRKAMTNLYFSAFRTQVQLTVLK